MRIRRHSTNNCFIFVWLVNVCYLGLITYYYSQLHYVHGRPIQYQWTQNGTGVMVRKPSYSFKRSVNVYKVRLNVYKIKR